MNEPMHQPMESAAQPANDIQAYIVGLVQKQIEDLEAADAAVAENLAKGAGGASVVLSVRLDPGERRALERRALEYGLKPSVLARNLIRVGLAGPGETALARALNRVEDAVAELREAVA
jgi:hypothetical protein